VSRLLGAGAHKRVYLADDTHLDRAVAIAVVERRQGESPDLDEARAMARVGDRPHVVAIHDLIETETALFIVSQYMAGGDLAARLRDAGGPLPLPEVLRIGGHLCSALECAHEGGIAHRDVKPTNVLLDERGDAFLGDFGLAALGERAADDSAVGTPEYMAPELLAGGSGIRADLYSLGCTLYELATGRPPFVSDSADELLRLHQLARPEPPSRWNADVPALLDDVIQSLLEKNPDRRPASCRDVRGALDGIRVAGIGAAAASRAAHRRAREATLHRPSATEPALIGRGDELARLEGTLTRLARSEPGIAFVQGEPGIGKSRLIRELRIRAEAMGARVLVGRAYEDEPLPYHPFVEALLPLAARLGSLASSEADLVRSFLRLDEPSDRSATSANDAARQRLFVALVRSLLEFARSTPIVLILDDLHWADSASAALLDHLASTLLQSPNQGVSLAVVGGLRPVAESDRIGRVVGRLAYEPGCEVLHLEGLGEDGVHALVESLGVAHPTSVLVRRLCDTSGGNPFFVRELVAHLERTGGLRRLRGSVVGAADPTGVQLPGSLTHVIADRTRRLAPRGRQLLALASVLGARFELAALAAVSAESPAEIIEALDEAVQRELLVDEGQAYHFSHSLVRQVVYQQAGASWAQRTHLSVARRLEQLSDASSGDAELQIAHHLIRAGPLATADEVTRHAAAAADCALAKCAWVEAIEFLEVALSAGSRLPLGQRAELHRKAGGAYFNTFDTGPCLHHLNEAIEDHRASGDVTGLARALNDRVRATAQFGMVAYGQLGEVAPLEEVLQKIDSAEHSLRARLTGTLAESYWLAVQPARATALASEALELAESAGDHELCSEICRDLALCHLQQLRIDAAGESWRRGATHARRANDLFGLSQCLARLPIALFAGGQLDEAEETTLEALDMNRIVQSRRGDTSLVLAHLVAFSVARGNFGEAESHAQRALDMIRRVKFPFAGQIALPALACARAMRGDVRGAHEAIDLLVQPGLIEDVPQLIKQTEPLHRAVINAYGGERIDPAAVPRFPPLPEEGFDCALVTFLCIAIELADAANSSDPDPNVRAAIELAAQRGIVFAPGWPYFVPRIRGVAAILAGELDAAVAWLSDAVALARRIGAEPEVARATVDHARALLLRGGWGDREHARALLSTALPGLREFGPRAAVERAERLAAFARQSEDEITS
jgi:tetratricopeptide (TPR) repeat protein